MSPLAIKRDLCLFQKDPLCRGANKNCFKIPCNRILCGRMTFQINSPNFNESIADRIMRASLISNRKTNWNTLRVICQDLTDAGQFAWANDVAKTISDKSVIDSVRSQAILYNSRAMQEKCHALIQEGKHEESVKLAKIILNLNIQKEILQHITRTSAQDLERSKKQF